MEKVRQVHSGTMEKEISSRELRHGRLARELAAEGFVLLKNDGMLPLELSAPIALLGSGAAKTVKGGTGSGDVNNRENVSIYQGMKEAGARITSERWLLDYQSCYEDARNQWKGKILEDAKKVENPFDAYAENPFALPEGRAITEEDAKGAVAAVYVISRISGEGKDRRKAEGDYYLSAREREDILYLNGKNIPIALILNVGAPIELTDILQEAGNIRAVLNVSLPGQEGGHAAADVLYGKAVPGGKLTATWAKRYRDYPSAESFGYLKGNLEREEYREGIYVGYRYFDNVGIEPLFPFGYGLSYTDFSISFETLKMLETGLEVTLAVKNTGDVYAGREVAQVYVTPPQAGLWKEYKRLAGFAKTGSLQPGESQRLTVFLEQKQFASFSEEKQAWLVEEGTYGLWIGNHSASLKLAALLTVPETVTLEETEEICQKQAEFQDMDVTEFVRGRGEELMKLEKGQIAPVFLFLPKAEKQREAETPIAREQDVEALIPLLYGNITQGTSNLGSAGIRVPGSAGETTEALEESYGIRSLVMADGPAGLRLRQSYQVDRETDSVYGVGVLGSLENGFLEGMECHEGADTYYQFCTAFPVGTLLAQAWDTELMERFGEAIAAEMEEFHVDLWLAPGMNIQRNPLCGRNFEYYSEDPYLSGMMAAAVTIGVQKGGKCGVTIKHLACNNQEDNRMGLDACVSQRALREIYLRGFEIAVKKSAPTAIMSSYNLINGVHAANSKDICTTLVRGEWGFEGVIMSDWNTTVPEDGSVPWQCAAAGNDIIMPGNPKDDADIRKAYERGELTEETIRACGGRVIAMAKRLG